ncbi:MAG: crossover junction endodeoxyribonuclease RuvC [Spirochaetota bacterium]
MIRVLGIDPGLAATGWGLVETDGSRYRYVGHGVITTAANTDIGARLRTIFQDLQSIISTSKPDESGVETLYFARNVSSALPVAQARGVVFLALSLADVPSFEYPPQAIKQSIVGQGRAEKHQVQELVRVLLGLREIPRPDHSADALAAAICHIAHRSMQERLRNV